MAAFAPWSSDERGFTIVEMSVAVSLMSIAVIAVGSLLVSHFNATVDFEGQSRSVDEVRIALGRVEKEFRSAECVYEPTIATPGGTAAGSVLRFKTRLHSGAYEVTYRVVGDTLVRDLGGGPEVVVKHLTGTTDIFSVTDATRRRLDIAVTIDWDGESARQVETSIAGRNAWRDC